jgi:hypothetical protein
MHNQLVKWITYLPNTLLDLARGLNVQYPELSTADIVTVINVAFNIAARDLRSFPFINPKYDYLADIPQTVYNRVQLTQLIDSLYSTAYVTVLDSWNTIGTDAEIIRLEVSNDLYVVLLWKK